MDACSLIPHRYDKRATPALTAVRLPHGVTGPEDAEPARTEGQAHSDQDDAEEDLVLEELDDPDDDEDHGEQPEQE
jgi:hypothetical protein